MKISEVFKSIQGEGKYTGVPVLFIRVSGCNRNCRFCDTTYHIQGKEMSIKQLIKKIKDSKLNIVVWTGGEPMLYQYDIYEVIMQTNEDVSHHIETNSDILPQFPDFFKYICFSPKEKQTAEKVLSYCRHINSDWDIKVVTDLKLNKEFINTATMLMPLTTKNQRKNKKIMREVWNYCVNNKIKYTSRVHIDVWGSKRGV